jgi:hypothetical protein
LPRVAYPRRPGEAENAGDGRIVVEKLGTRLGVVGRDVTLPGEELAKGRIGEAQPRQRCEGAVVQILAVVVRGFRAATEEVEFEDGADLAPIGRRPSLDAQPRLGGALL